MPRTYPKDSTKPASARSVSTHSAAGREGWLLSQRALDDAVAICHKVATHFHHLTLAKERLQRFAGDFQRPHPAHNTTRRACQVERHLLHGATSTGTEESSHQLLSGVWPAGAAIQEPVELAGEARHSAGAVWGAYTADQSRRHDTGRGNPAVTALQLTRERTDKRLRRANHEGSAVGWTEDSLLIKPAMLGGVCRACETLQHHGRHSGMRCETCNASGRISASCNQQCWGTTSAISCSAEHPTDAVADGLVARQCKFYPTGGCSSQMIPLCTGDVRPQWASIQRRWSSVQSTAAGTSRDAALH